MINHATDEHKAATSKFGLTPKQDECLRFIAQYIKDTGGISPSFEEIRIALNVESKSSVARLVGGLEVRGFIRRIPNATRSLALVE